MASFDSFNPFHGADSDIEDLEPVPAHRLTRLAGAVIDVLLLIAVTAGVYGLMGLSLSTELNEHRTLTKLSALPLFFLLQGWTLFTRGQTLGKIVVDIRIVQGRSTHRPKPAQLLMRYVPLLLLAAVPKIGPVIVLVNAVWIFGRQRRCLHDHLADTRVIRRS